VARIGYFLVDVVSIAVEIYIWLIIARVIISYFRPRSYHPVIRFIYEITEPLLALCRRFLPGTGVGLDFSPLVAIIILELGKWLLVALINSVFL